MQGSPFLLLLVSGMFLVCFSTQAAQDSDGEIVYDEFASTECERDPREPLYKGGILGNPSFSNGNHGWNSQKLATETLSNGQPYVVAPHSVCVSIPSLTQNTKYALSAWVQIRGADSALVTANVSMENSASMCAGTVIARSGCWSFLKGGFAAEWSPSDSTLLFLTNNTNLEILVASVSLQPFSDHQWRSQQQRRIKSKRKRAVIVHVSDRQGNKLPQAQVAVSQKSWDFPFGSAIAKTILANQPYQKWFAKRFNTAVFENELKWYATEPKLGAENYTDADAMLAWCQSQSISVRGHNIFWEDPRYTPQWVLSLGHSELQNAVVRRIRSLVKRYSGRFLSWDVSNELLHFSLYEQRLGSNASRQFFAEAQKLDPWTPLFMNDYNVIETCQDSQSTVDSYVEKLKEFMASRGVMEGIGLESHFERPNVPFMRAVLDKLATLRLPLWLTEVDVSSKFDLQTQAAYLEDVMREGFSHPAVEGIVMWTALHPGRGCYQMCLTDDNFNNLPAGSVVDRLISEWSTEITGTSDRNGCFKFHAFKGSYDITVSSPGSSSSANAITVQASISSGRGVQHIYIQL